ncbi:MAG: hypothetical protein LUO88_02310 [Methanoregulaceae archaeon]|nr:hypothetical protein [Methanoregulaceae archaeon]
MGTGVVAVVVGVPGALVGTEVAITVVVGTGGVVVEVTGAVGTVVAGVVPDGVLVHPAVTITKTRITMLGKMYRFRLPMQVIPHLREKVIFENINLAYKKRENYVTVIVPFMDG